MGTITPDSLLSLEVYAKIRKSTRKEAIAHRWLRTVRLGEHISVQFEDEQTVRRQIQEMLHIERIFEEEGIQDEIDAYQPLVPDGTNWKATMLLEYPDVEQRRRELARLIDIEDRMYIEVEGHPRVYAIADEDLERETEEKTSSVHFLRFELDAAQRDAIRSGARVTLGCDHPNYTAATEIPAQTLASLAGDLR